MALQNASAGAAEAFVDHESGIGDRGRDNPHADEWNAIDDKARYRDQRIAEKSNRPGQIALNELSQINRTIGLHYTILIKTGNRNKAGTNANVFLTLEGSNGTSEESALNNPIPPVMILKKGIRTTLMCIRIDYQGRFSRRAFDMMTTAMPQAGF